MVGRKRIVCLVAGLCMLTLNSACHIVREDTEIAGLAEEFVGMTHPGKKIFTKGGMDVDIDEMTGFFLNLSEEEAWEYQDTFYSVVSGDECPYFMTEKYYLSLPYGENSVTINFHTHYENAYTSYALIVYSEYIKYCQHSEMLRAMFPEENLDSCTKEEALAFCRPYAELLGYKESNAEVYAMTLELFQNIEKQLGYSISAPIPGYTRNLISKEEMKQAYDAGGKLAAYELTYRYDEEVREYSIPWSKKDECFLVNYTASHDGVVIEGGIADLTILYAPQYEKPVLLIGSFPRIEVSAGDDETVITSEDAVKKMMAYKGIESMEEIQIEKIEPVYMQMNNVEDETLGNVTPLMPYWRILYTLNHEKKASAADNGDIIYIDAIYGEVWN